MKTQKAEFYFGLSKNDSKCTFFRTQIVQLMSKLEKWVLMYLSERGASEVPSAAIFWSYFWLFEFGFIIFGLS